MYLILGGGSPTTAGIFSLTVVPDRVILYDLAGFRGRRITVTCNQANLGNFNDKTASARVLGMYNSILMCKK